MYHDKDSDPRTKHQKFPIVTPAALPPISSIVAYPQGPVTYQDPTDSFKGESLLMILAMTMVMLSLYAFSSKVFKTG